MPALFMRLSFWKLLIVAGLVMFFFWPLFAKLACLYLERRRRREAEESWARGRRGGRRSKADDAEDDDFR